MIVIEIIEKLKIINEKNLIIGHVFTQPSDQWLAM